MSVKSTAQPFPSLLSSEAQASIQNEFKSKWQSLLSLAARSDLKPPRSRRFKNEAWLRKPEALLSAHAWELYTETLQSMVSNANLQPDVQQRLSFLVMQWAEAACPANFLVSNPEAQQKLLETQGASLMAGLTNFCADLQKGRLTQTDESQFGVGKNIAITPGAVVLRNTLFELIHYQPVTAHVRAIPLLIVPPCINKYYILDLQERNSFVKYAVDQGFQVFLMSWRNPLSEDSDGIHQATWGDYLDHGVLEAVEAVKAISRQGTINTLGFCVGGTLLSSALALAQARGEQPCNALTLLTTMLDFHDVGPLQVFVDEALALLREWQLGAGGLLSAGDLSSAFAFLRPSELVWNYVTDNYLKGETPAAFDLLYWNADGTNLPGPFFTWYFRNTYLQNKLKEVDGVRINGHDLDFRRLTMPAYVYGSKEDHIVPWKSSFQSAQLLSGDVRFVLGASGHIAGVINPPVDNRRHYWVADPAQGGLADSPDEWFAQGRQCAGSWWKHWASWLEENSGEHVDAPSQLGGSTIRPWILHLVRTCTCELSSRCCLITASNCSHKFSVCYRNSELSAAQLLF
ncbi:alpha/beta fold hydrolase [Paenalcaligenes niemegkensis]|nr:alpha/beta fold hydrolase [Paenalcaligenes niemegkensis]MCQ9615658.1 alpha/beta fold hydrolase [Paenalcaligenes niemegkensis]